MWRRRATRLSDAPCSMRVALRAYHEVRPFYTPPSLAIAHKHGNGLGVVLSPGYRQVRLENLISISSSDVRPALQKSARFHERQPGTLAVERAASKRRGQRAHRGIHSFLSPIHYAPIDIYPLCPRSKTYSPKFMETSRRVT